MQDDLSNDGFFTPDPFWIPVEAEGESPLDQVFKLDGKDRFSSEAIERFDMFLKEGQFIFDKSNLIEPDGYPWLDPVYRITRTEVMNNKFKIGLVVYKPSQIGATTAALLFLIWLCLGEFGLKIGFFFPQKTKLEIMVGTRFNPILKHPKFAPYLKPGRVDNLGVKEIGNSLLMFFYTDGVGAVDTFPLNVGWWDEVRNMPGSAVELADHRLRAQPVQARFYSSTAGAPNDTMEKLYEGSTKMEWHTQCANCSCSTDGHPGKVMANMEVEQIIREVGGITEFYCGDTGLVLEPTKGHFVAHAPDAPMVGIHFPAFVNPLTDATMTLKHFREDGDRKEFWNNYFAKATISSAGAFVNYDHLRRMKELGASYGERQELLEWSSSPIAEPTYFGVDCRTQELHLVVGTATRITWLEVFQGANNWQMLEKRIEELAPNAGIIDYIPLTDLTLAFVKRNPVASVSMFRPGAMARWRDAQTDSSISGDAREAKMALFDQVKSFVYGYGQIKKDAIAFPPGPLYQAGYRAAREKGKMYSQFDVAGEFLDHLLNVELVHRPKEERLPGGRGTIQIAGQFDESIGKGRYDPHFAFAFIYMIMATHLHGGGGSVLSMRRGQFVAPSMSPYASRAQKKQRVCGECKWFDLTTSFCSARSLTTPADDPVAGCVARHPGLFKPRPQGLG